MLEVPALVWQLDPGCCRRLDFLSVGTNDLMQFFFAADRGNPQTSDRYDFLVALPSMRLLGSCAGLMCDVHDVPVVDLWRIGRADLWRRWCFLGLGLSPLLFAVSLYRAGETHRALGQYAADLQEAVNDALAMKSYRSDMRPLDASKSQMHRA